MSTRRARALWLLPLGLLMALPSLVGTLRLPVLHAHGGIVHSHEDGGLSHSHTAQPHAHGHGHAPRSAARGTVADAHRREHERMPRDEILARMVRVAEEKDNAPAPRAPVAPPAPEAPPCDPSWCSLQPVSTSPEGAIIIVPPACPVATIPAAPAQRPADAPGMACSGRGPPRHFSPSA
jgi:hypothetical protein